MNVLLVCLLSQAFGAYALVGYDCTGNGMNVTTLSLLNIGECEAATPDPKATEERIQLLQLSEFDHTTVIQCKIEISRIIYHCGMHSHTSIVQNGQREYLMSLSHQTCQELHTTGLLYLGGNAHISGIKPNSTDTRSVTLAGNIGVDGTCTGTQYSDPYGTWDNVVVQASVKITLQDYIAPVKFGTNVVILQSGLHCAATTDMCMDTDGGDTFWSLVPEDSCHFSRYDVLYEGIAEKVTPQGTEGGPVMYTVTTRETTFALTKTTETLLCGYTLIKTEHPKLFILEVKRQQKFKIWKRISVDNLDIFSYVNSKFIYVEKHIKTQITDLYKNIMSQKCALEKQVLKNALALSSIAPEEMAYTLMKGPGYLAVTAGEVIHIIKCIAVTCKLRSTEECYQELPVVHQNQSLFLSPKSRILVRTGTVRDCNELIPAMYQMDGLWYKLVPRPIEALAPPEIQPLSKPEWKYVNPSSLASSGIYSDDDINRLRDHIMFPIEKPSLLNTLAQGAMGRPIPPGSISMYNLLDEKSLDQIAESTGKKIWNWLTTFGSASAGVLAIILIFRLIKLTVDTVIHGYAIHSVYGWSVHLFGAIWSSITHLLVHLGQADDPSSEAEDNRDTEPAYSAVNITARNYPDLSHYFQPANTMNSAH